jgi:hypothetical protein
MFLSAQQNVPQHDRVVMNFIASGKYERHPTVASRGTQLRKRIPMIADLGRCGDGILASAPHHVRTTSVAWYWEQCP